MKKDRNTDDVHKLNEMIFHLIVSQVTFNVFCHRLVMRTIAMVKPRHNFNTVVRQPKVDDSVKFISKSLVLHKVFCKRALHEVAQSYKSAPTEKRIEEVT